MMLLGEKILLNGGQKMPRLALGTWFMEKAETTKAVQQALNMGYQRLDIDADFPNLPEIGEALISAHKPPFLSVKLPSNIAQTSKFEQRIKQIFADLACDHIDMLIMRKADSWQDTLAVWHSMRKLLQNNRVSALGVTDFGKEELQRSIGDSLTVPELNQVVVRIGQTPTELLEYDRANDIATEAYSVVPHGLALRAPIVAKIAAKYDVSITQLCLRYAWQLGLAIWRKAVSPAHMKENIDIDFKISEPDMKDLGKLKIR